jgi:surfeit locus 1 family protein
MENGRHFGHPVVTSERRLWPLLLASAVVFCLLCGLGVWQVFRLQEKQALIAAIDARLATDPIPLADALKRREAGEDVEYVKVATTGAFLDAANLRKIGIYQGSAGQVLIAPLYTSDNVLILADRGAVPVGTAEDQVAPPKEPARYTGILRAHNRGQGFFDAENDPATNQWFWWDVPAMLGAVAVPETAKVSNLILQLLPRDAPTLPQPEAPKAELRNNHLGYAITWFGLAAALVVMTGLLVMRK